MPSMICQISLAQFLNHLILITQTLQMSLTSYPLSSSLNEGETAPWSSLSFPPAPPTHGNNVVITHYLYIVSIPALVSMLW